MCVRPRKKMICGPRKIDMVPRKKMLCTVENDIVEKIASSDPEKDCGLDDRPREG